MRCSLPRLSRLQCAILWRPFTVLHLWCHFWLHRRPPVLLLLFDCEYATRIKALLPSTIRRIVYLNGVSALLWEKRCLYWSLVARIIPLRGLILDNSLAWSGPNTSTIAINAGVILDWVHLEPDTVVLLWIHLGPKIRHLRHVSCRLVSCSALIASVPGWLDQVWACLRILICLLHLCLMYIILLHCRMLVLFLHFLHRFARRAYRRGFGWFFESIDLVFFETSLEVWLLGDLLRWILGGNIIDYVTRDCSGTCLVLIAFCSSCFEEWSA